MGSSYDAPTYATEKMIAGLYGTDEEKRRVNELIDYLLVNPNNVEKNVELAVITEEIQRREITRMDWMCSPECDRYATCKIKWYRGERGMPQYCCSYCPNYQEGGHKCLSLFQKFEREKKTLEHVFVVFFYGQPHEISEVEAILHDLKNVGNRVTLDVIAEEVKRREASRLESKCCEMCERYRCCRIKWHRGERGMQQYCCSYCQNYRECRKKFRGENTGPVISPLFIVNMYGDDSERERAEKLIADPDKKSNLAELSALSKSVIEGETEEKK